MLNPLQHANTQEKISDYKVEPYIVAADIYSQPPHTGSGGWTWYTGSAAWMYRLGIEKILGISKTGNELTINPCVPHNWPGFEVTYRYGNTEYHIQVKNPKGIQQGVRKVSMDLQTISNRKIMLVDDRRKHEVQVVMGKTS